MPATNYLKVLANQVSGRRLFLLLGGDCRGDCHELGAVVHIRSAAGAPRRSVVHIVVVHGRIRSFLRVHVVARGRRRVLEPPGVAVVGRDGVPLVWHGGRHHGARDARRAEVGQEKGMVDGYWQRKICTMHGSLEDMQVGLESFSRLVVFELTRFVCLGLLRLLIPQNSLCGSVHCGNIEQRA